MSSTDIVEAAQAMQEQSDEEKAALALAAQAAIDQANEKADAAQAMAQQLTDAALQTELGRQISTLRQDNETWRTQTQTTLETIQQQQAEILTKLIPQTQEIPEPSSLIPQKSAEKNLPEVLNPDDAGADGREDHPEKQPTRKRRIL